MLQLFNFCNYEICGYSSKISGASYTEQKINVYTQQKF